MVQAVADANTAAAPVVLLLTRGAQLPHGELWSTYGTYGSGIAHAGVWGLARSVRSEAQLPVRCIDGALSRSKEVGLALSEPEAVVLGDSLLVPRLSHAPSLGRPTRSRLGGAHVVSGGTNGLGLLTGRWVAQRGASAVVLSSRSGRLADGTASELEQLVASGCVAMVVQSDTAEVTHVRRMVASAHAVELLSGVWHSAGVVADGLLAKQSAWSLARVYAPKVHGGWSLHSSSMCTPLMASVLFSSIASVFGGAGQVNYSAANQCLDVLASHGRMQGVCSLAIQWGAWADVGMASRGAASDRVAAMEATSGLGRISVPMGLGALQSAVFGCAPAVLAMLPVQWHRLLSADVKVPDLLQDMAVRTVAPPPSGTRPAPTSRAPPTCRRRSLDAVLEMVRRTAGNAIDADAPLMEAGVDSLGAVELRNSLQRAVGDGMVLSSTLMFDHPTARRVAAYLQGGALAGASPASAVTERNRAVDALVEVTGLSASLPSKVGRLSQLSAAAECSMDLLSEIPAERWDMEQAAELVADPRGAQPGSSRRVLDRCRALRREQQHLCCRGGDGPAAAPATRRGYAALHAGGFWRGSLMGAIVAVNVGQWASEYQSVLLRTPRPCACMHRGLHAPSHAAASHLRSACKARARPTRRAPRR